MIRTLTALFLLPFAGLAGTTVPVYEEVTTFPRIDGRTLVPLVESRAGGIYGAFIEKDFVDQPGPEDDNTVRIRPGGLVRLRGNKMEVLHRFTISDGLGPISMIEGDDGSLYGTCLAGGSFQSGTVWSYNPSKRTMRKLADMPITMMPALLDSTAQDGTLFGRTPKGLFRCTRGGELAFFLFSSLLGNAPPPNETHPTVSLGLTTGSDGIVYGTTGDGGINGGGVFFRSSPSAEYERIAAFDQTIGRPPTRIVEGSDGAFYGVADKVVDDIHHPQLVRMTTDGQVSIVSDFDGLTFANNLFRSAYIGADRQIYVEVLRADRTQSDPADYLFRFDVENQTVTPVFTYAGEQRGALTMVASNGNVYGTKEIAGGPHVVTKVSLGLGRQNRPPYALPDVITLPKEATSVTFRPLINDGDADGDFISVTEITVPPELGTVDVDPLSNKITYTADTEDVLVDTFVYTVSDLNGGSATARVRIHRAGPSRTYAGVFTFGDTPAYCRVTVTNGGVATGVIQVVGNTVRFRKSLNGDRQGEFERPLTATNDDEQIGAAAVKFELTENLPAGTDTAATLALEVDGGNATATATFTEVSSNSDAFPQYSITIPPFDPLADSTSFPDGTNVQVNDKPTVRPSRLAGAGWASMQVSEKGNARLTGKLADGSPISFGGPMAPGRILPIYAVCSPRLPKSPAPPRGFFTGVLEFESEEAEDTDADCSGMFRWTRPWSFSGIFKKGFAILQPVAGFRYKRPGELNTNSEEGVVHPVTLDLGAMPGLTAMETDGTNEGSFFQFPDVKGSFIVSGKTGIVRGTLKHPQLAAPSSASGIVIRRRGQLVGFYKTPNGTGQFIIKGQ